MSTATSGARRTSTGSPSSTIEPSSARRSWARFQRSAPSGSFASENSSSAISRRAVGRSESNRYASSAHAFRPRGAEAARPSRRITGGPSSRMLVTTAPLWQTRRHRTMPRYLIHRALGDITDDQLDAAAGESRRVRDEQFPEIEWEHSHVVTTGAGKVAYCVYGAPDA